MRDRLSWLKLGPMSGCINHVNEASFFLIRRKSSLPVKHFQVLNKDLHQVVSPLVCLFVTSLSASYFQIHLDWDGTRV